MKKFFNIFLSCVFVLSSSIISFASYVNNQENIESNGDISLFDMDIADGSVSNATQFQNIYYLNKKNGKTVNFYIENTGDTSVKITINGKKGKVYKSGDKGHISASVTGNNQKFVFKSVSEKNGGKISIDYIIAQRD